MRAREDLLSGLHKRLESTHPLQGVTPRLLIVNPGNLHRDWQIQAIVSASIGFTVLLSIVARAPMNYDSTILQMSFLNE